MTIRELVPAYNSDTVLKEALGSYENCLILGWNKEGEFEVRGSMGITSKDYLWLVELFKYRLINGDYSE